jgi:3-dehydroquinate synthase class II
MDIDIDIDDLLAYIEELFNIKVVKVDDDEHAYFMVEGSDPDDSVEWVTDLLTSDQVKQLESHLRSEGYDA